jgi:hypothetical protein
MHHDSVGIHMQILMVKSQFLTMLLFFVCSHQQQHLHVKDLRHSQASKIALTYLPLCIQTLGLQCHWPLFLDTRCAWDYCPEHERAL